MSSNLSFRNIGGEWSQTKPKCPELTFTFLFIADKNIIQLALLMKALHTSWNYRNVQNFERGIKSEP